MIRLALLSVLVCAIGCFSPPSECEPGDSPCSETEGYYRVCKRDPGGGHVGVPEGPSWQFEEEPCPGIAPVCEPEGERGHVCVDTDPPEPCSATRTLLESAPVTVLPMRIADLTGDGRVDVLIPCMHRGTTCGLWLARQAEDGAFESLERIAELPEGETLHVLLADADGDGALDVNVSARWITGDRDAPYAIALQAFLAREGAFEATPVETFEGDEELEWSVGDLEGDGKAEVLLANGQRTLAIALATDGTFTTSELEIEPAKRGLLTADLRGDGKPLLLASDFHGIRVYQRTDSRYVEVNDVGLETPLVTTTTDFADFDGDGALDVLYPGYARDAYTDTIVLEHGLDAGVFEHSASALHAEYREELDRIGDVDGDGDLDWVGVHGGGILSVVRGNGARGLGEVKRFQLEVRPGSTALGDVDGDGSADLVYTLGGDDSPRPQIPLVMVEGACSLVAQR